MEADWRHADGCGSVCDLEVKPKSINHGTNGKKTETKMNQHIEQAIENFRNNASRYEKTERYYRGEHNLAFASEKFQNTFGTLFREFALNLCPVICDALRDKLKVTGFSIDQSKTKHDVLRTELKQIWQRNRMAIRSGEIHKEALKNGDAYVIVWPGVNGEAMIFGNKAASCTVVYDDEIPGRIVWAAKYWRMADGRFRLNLFYPDRIERYASSAKNEGFLPGAKGFAPFTEAGSDTFILDNAYGVVPVFHFANNADIGMPGMSELEAAIPVQDGLNKSVLDMLVAMEYSSFRQRWAAGIELEADEATGAVIEPFKSGVDRLWTTQNPEARFGDFQAADLNQFLNVKDGFRADMASVTGMPLHYFSQHIQGLPSGDSLKKSETRFLAKVRDRQESFGQIWADVMEFAARCEGIGSENRLLTMWEDPAPLSEREFLENLLLKKQLGTSAEQTLSEAGYGDDDLNRMLAKTAI